jgi:Icc protein
VWHHRLLKSPVRTSIGHYYTILVKQTKNSREYFGFRIGLDLRMSEKMNKDGIDRRGFLECMAWAGTGMVYAFSGGIARASALEVAQTGAASGFHFVQISDSHIGFKKEANNDVLGTLQAAVDKINALDHEPAFVVHTGDISHLSKPEEWEAADSIIKTAKAGKTLFLPGEHDVLTDNGKSYLNRYGKGTKGDGWFSFNSNGMHFIGLVNVLNLRAGGLGSLGREQLEWLENDLKAQKSDTPIAVFAHVPLWTVYEQWGWGTEDGLEALAYLKRFGSVSILNGHIHQNIQKVEGNITFHTACSTAFPQPKPGAAPSPGPLKVPADQLRRKLGLTNLAYIRGKSSLAVMDSNLEPKGSQTADVKIENFSFAPGSLTISVGAKVTWTNRDDIPHNVVSEKKLFASSVLDTGEIFSHVFEAPGEYPYYCSIHPKMTGTVVAT